MRLTILGASGRIGRHVVTQALDAGHEVTVLVRDPSRPGQIADRVRVVRGTVADADAVDQAVAGAQAVISALGPDANQSEQVGLVRDGMGHTISAMRRHGVGRIVNLSGAGITAPREHKPMFDRSRRASCDSSPATSWQPSRPSTTSWPGPTSSGSPSGRRW